MVSLGRTFRDMIARYRMRNFLTPDDPKSTAEVLREMEEADPETFLATFRKAMSEQADQAERDYWDRQPAKDEAAMRDESYWGVNIRPDEPMGMSLETFKGRSNQSVRSALKATQQWVNEADSTPGMLALAGPPGVGKTHLAAGAYWRLRALGRSVLYFREETLIAELYRGTKTGVLEEVRAELAGVPWLVVDDLGVNATTDWLQGAIDGIVNVRWENAGRVGTMVTTNLQANQLPARTASRLRDMSRAVSVQINAEDYRVTAGGYRA